MKLVKILTIPAVLVLSMALAVPAFAHNAEVSVVKFQCVSGPNICVTITADLENSNGRDIKVSLLGHKVGRPADEFVDTGLTSLVVHLTPGNNTYTTDNTNAPLCFKDVPVTTFDQFRVKIEPVTDQDLDLTVDTAAQTSTVRSADCPTVSPSPPQSPSPSPSMQTVATLASTGGLDLRLPLIGLTVIVAGLALYLVSAGRGRPSTGR